MNYWIETLQEILPDHGVNLTDDQISKIASDIEGAASVQGEYESIATPTKKTAEPVVVEILLSTCSDCGGSGYTGCGPSHVGTCLKCDGSGRIRL